MLFRFHFGIRGMLSGGIIGNHNRSVNNVFYIVFALIFIYSLLRTFIAGGTLGTMCGILYWGLLKITGLERNEVKYAQFSLAKYHEE